MNLNDESAGQNPDQQNQLVLVGLWVQTAAVQRSEVRGQVSSWTGRPGPVGSLSTSAGSKPRVVLVPPLVLEGNRTRVRNRFHGDDVPSPVCQTGLSFRGLMGSTGLTNI